jgi:hypothetical protein
MTTDLTTSGLTREHLKVLRNADTIVARYYAEDFKYHDGTEALPRTLFDCTKEVDPGDGFGKRALRTEVPIEPARLTVYRPDSSADGPVANDRRPLSHALWILHPKWNDNPAHALVHSILRVGDRVSPEWVCNNNNDHVRNAGLTVDEFRIVITRGPVDDTRKCKRITLLLDMCVYPPGSDARNVIWA